MRAYFIEFKKTRLAKRRRKITRTNFTANKVFVPNRLRVEKGRRIATPKIGNFDFYNHASVKNFLLIGIKIEKMAQKVDNHSSRNKRRLLVS